MVAKASTREWPIRFGFLLVWFFICLVFYLLGVLLVWVFTFKVVDCKELVSKYIDFLLFWLFGVLVFWHFACLVFYLLGSLIIVLVVWC